MSFFDRPVRHLVFAQNPWPYASLLAKHGCEIIESDYAPEGMLLFLDLDEFDKLLKDIPGPG